MIANLTTKEIQVTDFAKGHSHDFQLFKDGRCKLSASTGVLADAGYQGLTDLHADSRTPVKKTQRHPLIQEQKASNRVLSRQRILIENIIRRLKIFRIVSERLRNRRNRFGLRFNLIAAIYNLDLKDKHTRKTTFARGLLKNRP